MKKQSYEEFIEKYKPKKTTDDCYTPIEVYNTIKNYVFNYYKLDENIEVVRPFYPAGDYESYKYPKNCVVIDNPPFSILKKIKDFFVKNNIKFFLFAPALTLFGNSDDKSICYVVTNTEIVYENGAKVNTSFVTNLDKYRIRVEPSLKQKILEINKNNKKIPKYEYPSSVITGAGLSKYIDKNIRINFKHKEMHYIKYLKCQKIVHKKIFGSGFLISDKKADELLRKETEALLKKETELNKEIIKWELSEEEKEIIKNLG